MSPAQSQFITTLYAVFTGRDVYRLPDTRARFYRGIKVPFTLALKPTRVRGQFVTTLRQDVYRPRRRHITGYNSIKDHINPVDRTDRSCIKIAIARQSWVIECARVCDNIIERFEGGARFLRSVKEIALYTHK